MLVLSLLIFFAHLHLQSHLMLPSGQKISISFWSHVILNLSRKKYTWDCYWSKCSSVFLELISAWRLYQRRQYHIFQLEHMKCFKCQTNSVMFNSYMYDCTVNTTLLNYSSLVFFSPNNWLRYSPVWAGTIMKWTIIFSEVFPWIRKSAVTHHQLFSASWILPFFAACEIWPQFNTESL